MCSVNDGDSAAAAYPPHRGFEQLDVAEVQRQLGLAPDMAALLARMERRANGYGPDLPGDAEAAEMLERLGVTESDRVATLAARPDPANDSALCWVLDRLYIDMLANMGQPVSASGFAGWPAMPAGTGAVGRHLYVWLYLAVLPVVRRYHTGQGVPDDISWGSLTALSEQMTKDRAMYGVRGIGQHWSLPLIFRGGMYSGLGRLAYDRQYSPVDFTAAEPGTTANPPRPGEPVVNVHIPSRGGPLDPIACDESIERARRFFSRHFPERPVGFICHTWILDPQLANYLAETSNIRRFQQRFRLISDPTERADRYMLRLIFTRDPQDWNALPDEVLDELPQDSTLQRAFVTHLRAGRHWFDRTGWFPL